MRLFLTGVLDGLKPRYSELTTFLTALTCVVVAFAYPEFDRIYGEILVGADAGKAGVSFIAIGLIATLGFCLSLIHVFTTRKKTDWEKVCMGVFAMSANGLAGIFSGIEMLSSRSAGFLFFSLWNIVAGVVLLYQIGLNRFEVTDEDAAPLTVLVASITLLLIFAITDIGLHLPWAIRFSVCMFYASTIVFFITQVRNLVQMWVSDHQ